MIPDVLCSPHTKSLCRVSIQELGEQITSFGSHTVRETERIGKDLAVHLVGVLVVEGR
jgi:hypothetical protein